jgi:3-hydroxyisobutyrate dehydrogenase-like beta-hydroxyacid dehydrogenase
MAKNLIKNGVDVTVYNRSKTPVEELGKLGATAATSYQNAVESAEIVFTMLSTPEVVREIAFGQDGFVQAMQRNAIWVDSSTVNPSFTLEMGNLAQTNNIRFIDAPVAGTLPHAENAQLTFFVGANGDDLETVEPLMNFMGQKVVKVGEVGKGASLKMLINAMLAQSMVVFSETVLLGEKMGLNKDFLLEMLPNTVVAAPFTKFKTGMIKEDKYDVMFPLEWMQKDLQLAAQSAYEVDQPLYMANVAKELFMNAKRKGLGRLDFAAIHRYLEE